MSWIHVVAALLLVVGTMALFAFLRLVDTVEAAEPARAVPDVAEGLRALGPAAVVHPRIAAAADDTYRRAA